MPSVPTEPSTEARELFRYRGSSMWPLFQDGDLLATAKVPVSDLRRGDCVVYRKPCAEPTPSEAGMAADALEAGRVPDAGRADMRGQRASTIHRIVSTKPEIRTQGDARPAQDDDPVAPEWILGKVETRIRCGKSSRVWGGLLGQLSARAYRLAGRLEPTRKSRGGRLARLIRSTMRPVTALWLRRVSVVRFRSADGSRTQYLTVGTRAIAERNDEELKWFVRWPWSLLFDPDALPATGRHPSERQGLPR